MAQVYVGSDESIEKAIKKFKKLVDRESILLEVKKRRYYTQPAFERHEKMKKLERKKRKKIMKTKKMF
ncbi:MAG: 30S ribosomal protein S21 [Spirochaetales bacterium]|nr:30S ribosomal protein S21 [Spirochaetales bacterium]